MDNICLNVQKTAFLNAMKTTIVHHQSRRSNKHAIEEVIHIKSYKWAINTSKLTSKINERSERKGSKMSSEIERYAWHRARHPS